MNIKKETSGEDQYTLDLQKNSDETLLRMASFYVDVSKYKKKDSLDEHDRHHIIKEMSKVIDTKERTISEMKEEIFQAMNIKVSSYNYSTFNKKEIQEIYAFITSKFKNGKLKE